MLSTDEYSGPSGKTPLLIAHGLFGSARNWSVISKRLSDSRTVKTVDMRNHGDSPRRDTHRYADMAGDLAATLTEESDVLGHSMGGKASMLLALSHPDRVRRLIVADIAPIGYSHTQIHLIEAMKAIDLERIERRSDADEQLSMSVEDKGVRAFLLQSLDVKNKRWKLNLDVLAQEMDRIIGFPEVNGSFNGPTLFLTGSDSDYVLPEHRSRIRELFPKARFAKLPGAGHWLHADKPREFEAAVRVFLDA